MEKVYDKRNSNEIIQYLRNNMINLKYTVRFHHANSFNIIKESGLSIFRHLCILFAIVLVLLYIYKCLNSVSNLKLDDRINTLIDMLVETLNFVVGQFESQLHRIRVN